MYNKQINATRYTKGYMNCPCCGSYLKGRKNKIPIREYDNENILYK